MTRQQLSLRAVFVFLMLLTCALGLPFLVRNEVIWSELNWVLLAGTISLSLALFLHSVVVASFRDAVALFAAAVVTGFAMELLGLHFGVPFLVHYEYHTDLQPQVGGVPLFIPLSWYALASVPVVLMRGMRLTSSLLRSSRVFLKSAVCAVFLVGADLLLDPLAVSVDAWRWVPEGPYFGVPVANYFGWFTVGMIIYY
ncbi:MAG: carotenoid biosynthesis protein, partial [Hyphomicrobiales bacterium]|nr:carotenoid biosynthesis protein [Hyphomicrobiales bacterium]